MKCSSLTLLCLFLLLSKPLICQPDSLTGGSTLIRTVAVEDGLPQGWVTDMVQDQQGFIWIASLGLSRYDGRSFIHYRHNDADSTSLTANLIRTMKLDDSNNLWITFIDKKSVDVINTVTGRVRHISTEPAFRWMQSLETDNFAAVQLAGRYFYGNGRELFAFDIATGSHQKIETPPGERPLAIGNTVQNEVVFLTNKFLYRFKNYQLQQLFAMPDHFADQIHKKTQTEVDLNTLYELVTDKQGNLICALEGGSFVCNIQESRITFISRHSTDIYRDVFIKAPDQSVFALVKERIFRFDRSLQLQPLLLSQQTRFNYPFFIDHSGLLWIASIDGNGIKIYSTHQQRFYSSINRNGFSHDLLQPWLKNPITEWDGSSYGLRWAKDTSGRIWIICPGIHYANQPFSLQHTAFRLDKPAVTFASFNKVQPALLTFEPDNQCWMVMSQDSKKWLAKANLQNSTYRTEPVSIEQILPDNPSLANGYLTATADKIILVGQYSLLVYDTSTTKSTFYSRKQLGVESFLLMAVPDPQNKNLLWIATQGSGMVVLDVVTSKMRHYTTATGLPDSTVYAIIADKQGYFWCSSNKGIFRFNPRDGSCISFTVKDGLPGNEFNRYHFMEMPDGRFAFGGPAGYVLFHPDSIYFDDFQPPAIISDIQVNNKPLAVINSQWKGSLISNLQNLVLPYNQNFLTLRFAGLEYGNPEKIQYRYKMEGLDNDWILPGTEAIARYTALNPGQYTFWVNASNTSGIWSSQVKKLVITIQPPWWKTTWAYLLYILLTGAVVYTLYRNWLQRAKARQQLILQQQETEQLKVVDEMKSRFFSNITHEFRTPLSLIIGPASQMLNDEPSTEWKKNIQVIDRNARQMLLLINQLLDMAKLEANNMKVALRRGNIGQFIRGEVQAFETGAKAKQIDLDLFVPDHEEEYLLDAEKLHTIFSNLLSNAIKFTSAGGIVSFIADCKTKNDGYTDFTFTVKDSGIGIAPEKLSLVFNRFYQVEDTATRSYEGTGIGLALAKELTELMNGTLTVESGVNKGTAFTLQLSLQKATGSSVPVYEPGPAAIPAAVSKYETPATVDADKPLILVAEDNEELRAFIARIFNQQFRVLTAANGAEGLQMANEELPDVIISDLMMPGMDGRDFCSAIKTNSVTNHIAFILLTARAAPASIIENLQNKADDYLTKPFVVEELQLRVKNLLERQEQLRRYFHQQLTGLHANTPNSPVSSERASLQNAFVHQLYTIVEAHLDDTTFSVDKLATAAAMSRRTLTRKLAGIADVSPAELIKKYRLKKAAELLQSGMSVAETTYQVGYESPASFSTLFKEAYGVPPSEYKTRATG